ncbi:MAG: SDR family oxidoreductase [Calditrichaeota bacterium]|nr:SDR family oxidoreductase [Calditrichota bacterium]MCB0269639.1 SDR family oxidoreductase [Calditrichota bacterium]
MNIRLDGKTAAVCGSTQGIGLAIAELFAELGANLLLIARNADKLQDICKSLSTSPQQQHTFLSCDFDEPEKLRIRLSDWQSTNPQPVHILVNNSGGPPAGTAIDAATSAFETAFNRHLICNQILATTFVNGMKTAGYGRIINIISTSVKQPIPGLGVSNTIRGAVASWAKTLAGELAPFGITVNNVLPGATETQRLFDIIDKHANSAGITPEEMAAKMRESIPARRFAEAHEVANAAAFLASPAAAYINGINLPVDGGRTACL